jgi:Tol biopolymer transport system component
MRGMAGMSGRKRKLVVAASAACVIALAVIVLRWPTGPRIRVLSEDLAVRWTLARTSLGLWRPAPVSLELQEVIEVQPRLLGASARVAGLFHWGYYGAISPDGSKVALVHGERGIRVYSVGEGEVLLDVAAVPPDEPPDMQVTEVAWDCSGDRLGYATSYAITGRAGDASVYSVDAEGQVTVWSRIRGTAADAMSWSPAGDRIALYYHADDTSLRTVCIVDRERGPVAHGPRGRQARLYPAWGPQGERLALLMEEAATGRTGCWEINAATGGSRFLTQAPVIPLAYSPDGQELVVVQLEAERRIAGFGLLDRETGSVRTVAALPGKMGASAYMWTSSPDTRYAAVVGHQEPDMFPIYLLDLDSFQVRTIRSPRILYPYDVRVLSTQSP